MAYANKYKITIANKSNTISYVYLLEDGYIGSVYEYPAVNLELQYIPQSDDVFESIMVSQLNLTIDVTDDLINMPNFTTLNDRKYLVKLYNENVLEWQGWALSDSVNLSYSTGRKDLSFNAIDGLGMLEKIKYPIGTSYYITDLQSCLSYLVASLNQIQFPTALNIISGISYYSDSMNDRSDGTQYEPLNQSYIRLVTFLDNNSVVTDCLTIIKSICKSFGAKIFQAEGKWYIITPNQFAQNSYYYTEYNSSLSVVSSGTKSFLGNIQAYTGNTSGLYYLDNSQTKILRKGYNKIRLNKTIDYNSNLITNGNLMIYTGNDAFGWQENTTGTGAYVLVKVYEETDFNSFILFSGNLGTASVYPNNLPNLNFNDVATLSFDLSNIPPNTTATKLLKVIISITDGTNVYYLDSNLKWISGTYSYYSVAYNGGAFPAPAADKTESISLQIPNAPLSGSLYITFLNDSDCYDWVEISNFKLDATQLFKSVLTESYISNSEDYIYDVELPIGVNYTINGKYYYRGALSDSSGNSMQNWYRYEYPSEIFNSLSELVIKQYSNILENNIINIDANIYGLTNTSGRLNCAMRFTSNDTDTINSVQNNKYILGNSTLKIKDEEIQTTLLQINNTNIETTLITTYQDNNPARVYGLRRSLGQTTSIGANAAPLTSNVIYLSGVTFYTDRNLAHYFNGGGLYYKVESENLIQYNIYHINSSGKIIPL